MAVSGICKPMIHGRRLRTMEKLFMTIFCVILFICAHPLESKKTRHKSKAGKHKNCSDRSPDEYTLLAKELDDPLKFKEYVEKITVPRVSGTPENRKVADYIEAELKNHKYHVEIDEFEDDTPFGKKKFRNIIGTFDKSKGEKLVLAAHYDSKFFEPTRNNDVFLGATDSAVPCAILLDLAEQLNCLISKEDMKKDQNTTLQLVFFDGEEAFVHWTRTDSTYGSRHLARLWEESKELKNIKYFVLLDLIGTRDVRFLNFYHKTQRQFESLSHIESQLRAMNIINAGKNDRKLFDVSMNFINAGIEDDHIPFLERGVDILHLIPVPFPSVWHKMSDNLQALDYKVTGDFRKIFRIFVANELCLQAKSNACRKK